MNQIITPEVSVDLTQEETIVALRRKSALFESSLKQAEQRIGDLQANIDSVPSASDLNPEALTAC